MLASLREEPGLYWMKWNEKFPVVTQWEGESAEMEVRLGAKKRVSQPALNFEVLPNWSVHKTQSKLATWCCENGDVWKKEIMLWMQTLEIIYKG